MLSGFTDIPVIAPLPPVLSANPTLLTTQKRLTGSGTGIFTDRIADANTVGVPYVAKDNAHIPLIQITHHLVDGIGGIIRLDNGIIDLLVVERSQLLRGRAVSASGQPLAACGLIMHAGAAIGEIIARNLVYDRAEGITSSGNIYAGIYTGGGHDDTHIWGSCEKALFENIVASNMWTNYPAGDTSYLNSDGAAGERTIKNVTFNRVHINGAADAGIDGKGPNWRCQATIVDNARESFKWWASGDDEDVYSRNPRVAHWLLSSGPDGTEVERTVEFAYILGDPAKPVLRAEKRPSVLRLTKGFFDMPADVLAQQVLVSAEPEAFGTIIALGDKALTVDKPVVMLSELGL